MSVWLTVNRSPRYEVELQAVHDYVEQDNPHAAMELMLLIDGQVDQLADPNFPRRQGRVAGTLELVAHPNYVVVIEQNESSVIVRSLLHVARQYP